MDEIISCPIYRIRRKGTSTLASSAFKCMNQFSFLTALIKTLILQKNRNKKEVKQLIVYIFSNDWYNLCLKIVKSWKCFNDQKYLYVQNGKK